MVLDIHTLHLPEHSPLLKDENVKKVFLEWALLDLPPDECETPNSFSRPTVAHEPLEINFRKSKLPCLTRISGWHAAILGIPMNQSRGVLLKAMLSANEK